nr:immunoglobulin light chain junction region [Macaca mulatta]MOW30558.1 immunoglobulin light chain junction region [Macaca mulatta]
NYYCSSYTSSTTWVF